MPKNKITPRPVVTYRPAMLIEGNPWYIEYYIWNPFKESEQLVRKRHKLTRFLKRLNRLSEKRQFAHEMIFQLNLKLSRGWNPFIENELSNAFKSIEESFNHFIKVQSHGKREDTIRTYRSMIANFKAYLEQRNMLDTFIITITPEVAIDFIDHIYIERGNGIRTRKNYVEFFTTVFEWFVKRSYVKENPFKRVDRITMRNVQKKRTVIDPRYRKLIVEYFQKENPGYLYPINYLFVCMVRRTEMTRLRVKDVLLENQLIYIDGSNAKNGRPRYATIPDSFMPALEALNLKDLPANWYLISQAEFYPGEKPVTPKQISDQWAKMRKTLDIPKTNQFYSLRDSGVVDYMSSHISNKSMVDQTGWHSYDMISVYGKHYNNKAIDEIKQKGQTFG